MTHKLNIGWLYPDLMSTYGDRGNILVLTKRCEWRGIEVSVLKITESTSLEELKKVDLLFGGGAQDREQTIVMQDLMKKKTTITDLIDTNKPALFVCGAPQLMGKYYEPAEGERIEGLGIFDMVTKHPGKHAKRLIGNTVAEVLWQNFQPTPISHKTLAATHIVGFENHGGRTQLGKDALPFAQIIKGYGNNGKDKTEGVVYKNAIGCYFHGPLLPKNPVIADWLIQVALEVKYKETIQLKPLDDTLELQAQKAIAMKLGVGV
jgi:lipid II isoglutaminyl synthase (glutamine-hydrolysing)